MHHANAGPGSAVLPAGCTTVDRVMVAMRKGVLRLGIERMLHTLGIADTRSAVDLRSGLELAAAEGRLVIALADEIDTALAGHVRAAENAGVNILLLLDETYDLSRLSRMVSESGMRGAGFLTVGDLSEESLGHSLARISGGEVPMPADLTRTLLTLAGQGARPAISRPRLTPREQQVLVLMVDGLSNKQIARRLHISDHGAKKFVANILAKLDCANRTHAVARALREGLHESAANPT